MLAYLETLPETIPDARFTALCEKLSDACTQFEAALKFKHKGIQKWGDDVVIAENELLLYLIQKLVYHPNMLIFIIYLLKSFGNY